MKIALVSVHIDGKTIELGEMQPCNLSFSSDSAPDIPFQIYENGQTDGAWHTEPKEIKWSSIVVMSLVDTFANLLKQYEDEISKRLISRLATDGVIYCSLHS